MKLTYLINNEIAPLSWCAVVKGNTTSVLCGKAVEVNDRFFVEGAWDSLFEEGGFCRSEWFCGTGGVIEADKIIFSTPTHVTSALYAINKTQGGTGYQIVCTF